MTASSVVGPENLPWGSPSLLQYVKDFKEILRPLLQEIYGASLKVRGHLDMTS